MKIKVLPLLISLSLLFISNLLFSQSEDEMDIIELKNPSFEDFPKPGRVPRGWYDCGGYFFPEETPPDVHPITDRPIYGVTKEAYDGETYLGLCVRANDSWESVAQRLKKSLEPNQCYSFNISLCRSENYKSSIRGSLEKIDFTTPVILRIWGGNGYCNKAELLGETDPIENTEWEDHNFMFNPSDSYGYIIFEAFYNFGTEEDRLMLKNGNILLDNASEIEQIICDEFSNVIPQEEILKEVKIKKDTSSQVEENLHQVINTAGEAVNFKDSNFDEKDIKNFQTISTTIKKLDNQMLVICFPDIRYKVYLERMKKIKEIFIKEELPFEKYYFMNTKYDAGKINWIFKGEDLKLGTMIMEN